MNISVESFCFFLPLLPSLTRPEDAGAGGQVEIDIMTTGVVVPPRLAAAPYWSVIDAMTLCQMRSRFELPTIAWNCMKRGFYLPLTPTI